MSPASVGRGGFGLLEPGSALDFTANPAVLPLHEGFTAGIGHAGLVEGLAASVTSVALVLPFGPEVDFPGEKELTHRYGIGIQIDHRSLELSQGSAWSSQTVAAGLAYAPRPYVSAGIISKLLFTSSDLEDAGAWAYGVDLGGRLQLHSRLQLGISVRNIAGQVSWEAGANERPPVVVDVGVSASFPLRLQSDFCYEYRQFGHAKMGFGLEAPVAGTGLCLRGGYVHCSGDYSRNTLTAGFGFTLRRYGIDYAVRMDDDTAFGVTHHVGLGFHPG
jgi:hypothetical protein